MSCKKLKKACKECPFRRQSAPGYLGSSSNDPMGFIHGYWNGPLKTPCHMQVDYESDNVADQVKDAPVCFGFATMCKNSAKLPIELDSAHMVKYVEINVDEFFQWLPEFIKHHG